MSKIGVILALVALGVAGWGASQLCEKSEQIDDLHEANLALQDRLTTLEVGLAAAAGQGDQPSLLTASGASDAHAPGAAAGLTGRAASPIDRLAALEKTVAEQDKLMARLKEENAAQDKVGSAMRRFSPGKFYGSMDTVAKALDLKDNQKSDMDDYLGRAKTELADLYKIENDEGVTWDQIRKPKRVEGGGLTIHMPDMAKIQKFKKSRIPGSSETFGQAEKRIRDNAFGSMRNVLSPKQAKKWDKAHKGPLLRGGGSGGFVSAISFVGLESDG